MTSKLSLTFFLTPLLLAIWLAGCGDGREDILPKDNPETGIPTLDLKWRDTNRVSPYWSYGITASEPLPEPIALRINMLAHVYDAGELRKVWYEIDVTFKRGADAWYGFFRLAIDPDGSYLDNILLVERDYGTVECIKRTAEFAGIWTNRNIKSVYGLTITITNPADSDPLCAGAGAYHIGISELEIPPFD